MDHKEPETLQEAVLYFANLDNCREYLVAHRWPDGVMCPRCGSKNVLFQKKYNRWQCGSKHDLRQFTAKPERSSKSLRSVWTGGLSPCGRL
ncbi:MAG: transposase [Acidobacteriaceae bacterium]|nr:transposase [Acidobacteriaceae bacterium]